jgi:hypothetical protein
MPRLFLANFDFEHHLAGRANSRPTAGAHRINPELAAAWAAVAQEGDFIWMPFEVDDGFFSRLVAAGLPPVRRARGIDDFPAGSEICPWGWTGDVRDWAWRNGCKCAAPSQEAVATANSRQFSASLEQQWGTGLDNSAIIATRDEFLSALAALPVEQKRWVVKANFGMAARERILSKGHMPDTATLNWVQKRLNSDGVVFLEPWVERIEEVGLQYYIPQKGPPQFEGCTPLLTQPSGQYRGSRFAHDAALDEGWRPAIDVGTRTAKRVQELGYFGPLGVDAVRYRDSAGHERLRPLQDINARWTMGRLALGFRKLLAAGELGSWPHVNWARDPLVPPSRWFDNLQSQLPADVRVVPTTPFAIDNEPTQHGSLVVMAPTSEALEAAERTIFVPCQETGERWA